MQSIGYDGGSAGTEGPVMRPTSQFPYLYGSQPPTFSAWTMAIVFIAVAMLSFAIDQAVILSPAEEPARSAVATLIGACDFFAAG